MSCSFNVTVHRNHREDCKNRVPASAPEVQQRLCISSEFPCNVVAPAGQGATVGEPLGSTICGSSEALTLNFSKLKWCL